MSFTFEAATDWMEKYEFGGYFEGIFIFISYIVFGIQQCYVMLKLLYLIPCQKMKGSILGKLVLDGTDFNFSLILEFAMVIRFVAFSSFMS